MEDYLEFVNDKMSRPWNDNAPWARITNILYAAIDRCVFVQVHLFVLLPKTSA